MAKLPPAIKSSSKINWVLTAALLAITLGSVFVVGGIFDILDEGEKTVSHSRANFHHSGLGEAIFRDPQSEKDVADNAVRVCSPQSDDNNLPEIRQYHSAYTLLEQGKFDDAAAAYDSVLKLLAPEAKPRKIWVINGIALPLQTLTAYCYQYRGYCHLQEKKYQLGIDDLTKAIELRPDYALNYRNRAAAYRLLGKEQLAADDDRRASASPKDN